MEEHDSDGGLAVDVAKPKVGQPKKFIVFLWNDDYTTMEFVVDVLMRIFHRTHAEAMGIMLKVHNEGKGEAGRYSRDIAETKAAQAQEEARLKGFPLKTTVEAE